MENLRIRCSSLWKIMGTGKGPHGLTATATTYIKQLVKQQMFEYTTEINSKYFDKGIDCENDAIKLYNDHFFTAHEKNEVKVVNEWITGTCDINAPNLIIDTKCSWDADTFPASIEDAEALCKKSGYEWQLIGYMWLYNKDKSELVYALVDTPEYLIEYVNDRSAHEVDHLDPGLRLTVLKFNRDTAKEELIKTKVEAARLFAIEYKNQIINKNK